MWDTVALTAEQRLIRDELRNLCGGFDDAYWREHDADGAYPHAFLETLAEHGWLGLLIPEAHGGGGFGVDAAVVMMEAIAASGAGFGGAQAIHGAIYTATTLVEHAPEDLAAALLPRLASGEETVQSLALTEPNAGSEATAIETTAERDGEAYVINGSKLWTSRVDVTDYLLLVARTTPREAVARHTEGISLFLVDLDDVDEGALERQPIEKTAVRMASAYQLWFDDLRVPADHLLGEEGRGFYHLLDGLNEERLVIAAECVGLGRLALERAAAYAAERTVFDRPIGQNQGIQHPLAAAYARVQAAKHTVYNAAARIGDVEREEAGVLANTAKYLAAEAAVEAADVAVQTHGGFGVAREYDVERYLRNARLAKIAPISQQLALSYLGERALDLPRSY